MSSIVDQAAAFATITGDFITPVPPLPSRRFHHEAFSLRTAYTIDEIREAERAIAGITTMEDVINHTGVIGTLFTCCQPSNEDRLLAKKIEVWTNQKAVIQDFEDTLKLVQQYPKYPPAVVGLIEGNLVAAHRVLDWYKKGVLEDLPALR